MKHLQTLDTNGSQHVTTLTLSEWKEAREAADLVHIVAPERSEGGWE